MTANRTITVQIKTVYGAERIYPLCENARVFAQMMGTKTLTRESIQYIKALTYDVIVKHEEVTL